VTGKQQILKAIGALAKQLGRAPSYTEFLARAGISRYTVAKLFYKWSDALSAAGFKASDLKLQFQDGELLSDWGETVRRRRAVPSRRAYRLEGKYDPRTLERRFGGWSRVPAAFRSFVKGKREWAGVVALLPVSGGKEMAPRKQNPCIAPPPNKAQHAGLDHRPVYGDPMDFRGLRHEPVDEQGVVFLFGMLARGLGFLAEAVQRGFPDCEAKRRIAPGRWQRVRIEFEFESRNYRVHGHPADGCDVIVCWRHNWAECPKGIEVVELSSVIKSFAKTED